MKSVSSIGKITGAMQMVASARMHQAQQRATASLPFARKLQRLLQEAISDPSVLAHLDPVKNPLLERRPLYRTAYIVIGSDKGLAGSYNSNIVKHTAIELRGKEESPLIAVGKQARLGLLHHGYNVVREWEGFSEKQPTKPPRRLPTMRLVCLRTAKWTKWTSSLRTLSLLWSRFPALMPSCPEDEL